MFDSTQLRHALLLLLVDPIPSYSFCMSDQHLRICGTEALPCDIIKNSITTLLIRCPLPDEHAGRGRGQLPAAQQPMPVPHVILETPFVHLTSSIATMTTKKRQEDSYNLLV